MTISLLKCKEHVCQVSLTSTNFTLIIYSGDFGLATAKVQWSGATGQNQPTGSILW